jgi:hypothetical protein
MRWILLGMVVLGLGIAGFACSSGTTSQKDAGIDGGTDGGTDGGVDGDSGPNPGRPTSVSISAGGGTIHSADHKARIHIGAPQPYGKSEGTGHKLQAGPNPKP